MMMYTTIGSVRGECGHQHRSILAAVRCQMRDSAGCAKHGGYSDRAVRHADGTRLSESEYYDVTQCEHDLEGAK